MSAPSHLRPQASTVHPAEQAVVTLSHTAAAAAQGEELELSKGKCVGQKLESLLYPLAEAP